MIAVNLVFILLVADLYNLIYSFLKCSGAVAVHAETTPAVSKWKPRDRCERGHIDLERARGKSAAVGESRKP